MEDSSCYGRSLVKEEEEEEEEEFTLELWKRWPFWCRFSPLSLSTSSSRELSF